MRGSKEEIIACVMETCLTGASKTAIVYGSNLNFKTVEPYIDFLVRMELITTVEGSPRRYSTTSRGKELLGRIKKVHELL